MESGGRLSRLLALGTALLAFSAVVRAWMGRWVCDDAFISFRYADHLAHGHGLVWNVGERVEAITNLLWTLALAPPAALGLDLVVAAQVLGLLSLLALAGVLARWSRARGGAAVALWVALAMPDMVEWTTGGLETMAVAALVAGCAHALLGREQPGPRRELAGGLLAALAILTRPDALLLVAPLIAFHGARPVAEGERWSRVLRVAGPLFAAAAGVTAFRLAYYGSPLPNSFYAKSAAEPYWRQGGLYVGLFLLQNHALATATVIAIVLGVRRGRLRSSGAVLALTVLLFTVYVARTGGDFMFARRLIPAVPLGLMAVESALASLALHARVAVGIGLATAAALPYLVLDGHPSGVSGVVHERDFYPDELVALRREQGEALGRALSGLDVGVAVESSLCMLAYYSRLPMVIEANGLTDAFVARLPVQQRGRPGHEKRVPTWYLNQRRVQLVVPRAAPERPLPPNLVVIDRGLLVVRVRLYDEALMNELARRPNVVFIPIHRRIEQVQADMPRQRCEEARAAVSELESSYLMWNTGTEEVRRALASGVEQRCASP